MKYPYYNTLRAVLNLLSKQPTVFGQCFDKSYLLDYSSPAAAK